MRGASGVHLQGIMIDTEGFAYENNPRFDRQKIGVCVDLLRRNPMFRHLHEIQKSNADEHCVSVLNKLSDLRWPCCINGCPHQCLICSLSSGAVVKRMPFGDYLYLLENLKAIQRAAGLRFSFGLYDVAPHYDGDTLMYFGCDARGRPAYSAYHILHALVGAGLFQTSEKPGRNRLQIFTSGFCDPAGSHVVTEGVRQIVKESDFLLGRDPSSGETGRIVVSFSNATRYLHGGARRRAWWMQKLVQMFAILRPLADRNQLALSIKYAPAGTGRECLECMTLGRILDTAREVLLAAGYAGVDRMLEDPQFAFVQRIYAQGRAAALPVEFSLEAYLAEQYPPDFSDRRLGTRREGMIRVNGSYELLPIKPVQPQIPNRVNAFQLWFPSHDGLSGCSRSDCGL